MKRKIFSFFLVFALMLPLGLSVFAHKNGSTSPRYGIGNVDPYFFQRAAVSKHKELSSYPFFMSSAPYRVKDGENYSYGVYLVFFSSYLTIQNLPPGDSSTYIRPIDESGGTPSVFLKFDDSFSLKGTSYNDKNSTFLWLYSHETLRSKSDPNISRYYKYYTSWAWTQMFGYTNGHFEKIIYDTSLLEPNRYSLIRNTLGFDPFVSSGSMLDPVFNPDDPDDGDNPDDPDNPDNPNNPGTGWDFGGAIGAILDALWNILKAILTIPAKLIEYMGEIIASIGGFFDFLGGAMTFVPIEVWTMISLGVGVVVLLRFLGR